MDTNVVAWGASAGSTHSLAHLMALSAERSALLCVSERSLSILQDLAAKDATFRARYALVESDAGFVPVSEDDTEWADFLELVENLQLEVVDMSCEVVAALNEIRDAIMANNISVNQQAIVCCSDLIDPGTYWDGDPETGSPAGKCDLAYSYAYAWKVATDEIYNQWSAGGFPAAEVLSAVLDGFDLPGQAVLEIATFGASKVLPVLQEGWAIATEMLLKPITCAIYQADGSTDAKTAIEAAINNQVSSETAAGLMTRILAYNSLNKVFDGTWTPLLISPYDCLECSDLCGYTHWELGEGDLEIDGQPRVWTAERDDNNDWYVAPIFDHDVEIEVLGLIGWEGDYPDFPDFRAWEWGVGCELVGPVTEVAVMSSTVGQTYQGCYFSFIMWRDWPEHFRVTVIVREITE